MDTTVKKCRSLSCPGYNRPLWPTLTRCPRCGGSTTEEESVLDDAARVIAQAIREAAGAA